MAAETAKTAADGDGLDPVSYTHLGLFWYYLEETPVRPLVHQEENPPCGLIYKDSRSLLFEVTYFHRRINLEVYHALTDGTGALLFLQAMVYHLSLIHI